MVRVSRLISRPWRHWQARYPNDDEAQIFYAITLNVAASPNDKTYANQLKGAAILEPIFRTPAAASRRGPLSHPPL